MPFNRPVVVLSGPDVSDWPVTAQITRVEFTPGNFLVRHTKEGTRPESWPPQHVPGWGDGGADAGDLQWTLYVVIDSGGQYVTAPCINYWPEAEPVLGVHRGGDGAPFSSGARNWWYQEGRMANRQPVAGQQIGVLAVAGGLRGLNLQAIRERSSIVWVEVPPHDTGVYTFDAPIPAPEPVPVPVPPVIPIPSDDRLLVILEQGAALLESQGEALARLEATAATKADLAALRREVLDVGKTLTAALTGGGNPLDRWLGRRS